MKYLFVSAIVFQATAHAYVSPYPRETGTFAHAPNLERTERIVEGLKTNLLLKAKSNCTGVVTPANFPEVNINVNPNGGPFDPDTYITVKGIFYCEYPGEKAFYIYIRRPLGTSEMSKILEETAKKECKGAVRIASNYKSYDDEQFSHLEAKYECL